jgi:hypothetical protein
MKYAQTVSDDSENQSLRALKVNKDLFQGSPIEVLLKMCPTPKIVQSRKCTSRSGEQVKVTLQRRGAAQFSGSKNIV